MRHMFLALALAAVGGFAVASCGNSNKGGGDMGADMSGGAPPDMVAVKLNCEAVGTCTYNCVISGQGDLSTCAEVICAKTAKPGSVTKYVNAILCGQNYCTGDQDMMNGKCVSQTIPADMGGGSILCDPGVSESACNSPSYMSTSCSPCLTAARNYWFFDESVDPQNPGPPTFMCPDSTNADCMAANTACATQFNACRNDM